MPELGKLSAAVEAVMKTCFSGTLEELKDSIRKLLLVDSPKLYKQFKEDVKSKDDTVFSCIELTALESIRDSKQRGVAHIAAAGGNINILQTLLTSSPSLAHVLDSDGESPLFYAIRAAEDSNNTQDGKNDRIDCLLLLVGQTGANAMSTRGISALHTAVELGDLNICKLLLDNGANVDIYSSAYGTPLSVAVVRNYLDIIKLLLEYGANPNKVAEGSAEKSGLTFPPPLVFASSSGQTDIVQLLLDNGADVDATDSEGWTALHCAAEYGHYDVAIILLKHNANCNIKAEGRNPYHVAAANGRIEMANLLRDYTEDTRSSDSVFSGNGLDEEPLPPPLDPSMDLEATVLQLKESGNEFIRAKDFINAANSYSRAISILRDIDDHSELKAILYSNRSHAYLCLKKLDEALQDAKNCIKFNEGWSKGYIRLANVYREKGEIVDYLHSLFQGHTRDLENTELCDRFRSEFERYKNNT